MVEWMRVCAFALILSSAHGEGDDVETMIPLEATDDGGMMAGSDSADSMPQPFPRHVLKPSPDLTLTAQMNAYAGGMAHEAIDLTKVLPSDQPEARGGGGRIPHLTVNQTIRQSQLVTAEFSPVEDETLFLLDSVKKAFLEADRHDAATVHADQESSSAFVSAKNTWQSANRELEQLLGAKEAMKAVRTHEAELAAKESLLVEKMSEKGELTKEAGTMKFPLIKQLGRTNMILKHAIDAKETVLYDFGSKPALSKHEKVQIINTYTAFIQNLKEQIAHLQKTADLLLTPIQLNLNQTSNDISRLKTEIAGIHANIDALQYLADKYTPEALEIAKAVEADTKAHYNVLQNAMHEHNMAFESRSNDRSDVLKLVQSLKILLQGSRLPQEPVASSIV